MKMKWMIIPIFLFSLIACVTTPERENEWVKPDATQHDYHVDSGQCKAQGFSVPGMSLIQAGIVYASCMQGKGWYLQEKLSAYDYFNNGYSASERGDYNQAIADYSKAIELKPNYADAYNNRGVTFQSLGNRNQAMADFKTSARLGNKNAQNYLTKIGVTW